MANKIYPKLYDYAFDPSAYGIDWNTSTFRMMFVKSSASYSSAHQFLSDIGAGDRVGFATTSAQALGGMTLASGALKSSTALTFTGIVGGDTVGAIVVYKDTGVEATSPLVCWIDTGTNLPFTVNGGNITVNWDGTNGVVKHQ